MMSEWAAIQETLFLMNDGLPRDALKAEDTATQSAGSAKKGN